MPLVSSSLSTEICGPGTEERPQGIKQDPDSDDQQDAGGSREDDILDRNVTLILSE